MIDTDESTYTTEILKTWRHLAELRARLSQELGRDIELTPSLLRQQPMPEQLIDISGPGEELQAIGEAIEASCMSQIWGTGISRALRDVLIEVAQNALTHGNAKSVKLKILPRSVQLIDDGHQFNPLQLRGIEHRGGRLALAILLRDFDRNLFNSYQNQRGLNILEFSWVTSQDEIRALTPCTVDIEVAHFWDDKLTLELPPACDRIYLMLPIYFALSWTMRIARLLKAPLAEGKDIVLVGEGLSKGVVEVLGELVPGIKVINFNESADP